MNWFKLECTTRAFVTALQLTVRYEMSVIIIIIIINVTSLLRHSLLINMPYTKEDKLSIKLLRQEKGWGAKHTVKSFLTGIGQSVLLEIFCARLTQRTQSLSEDQ